MFFDEDDAKAEGSLAASPPSDRAWLALYAFGYTFLPVLTGIVLFAAGVKLAIAHYGKPGSAATVSFLAAGVSLYSIGLAVFRGILQTGPRAGRLVIAGVALTTAFVGSVVSPGAELAALAGILVAGIIIAHRRAGGERSLA